ncbi:transglutaminase family protein [Acetobacter estunensis]|uniref:transglutaminase family protein n=1 Tax=Acetobacter estunensis TaxID=104097 RepID=UPI001C2CDFC7|nr:transglutaminase family protein [Acetobacter estunensis]
MSAHVALRHRTSYHYDRPVSLGPQTIRLHPREIGDRVVLTYELDVGPADGTVLWKTDGYDNTVAEAVFAGVMSRFDIEVRMTVDLSPYDPLECRSGQMAILRREAERASYRMPVVNGPFPDDFLTPPESGATAIPLDWLRGLNQRIASSLTYRTRFEPGVWSPVETLTRRSGSCRDSAWLFIALARRAGFAARFVSGYLVQNEDGNGGALTCDLHAWAEVFVPERGWLGFDTTSGQIVAQNHIALAVSAVPEEAAPVSGLLDRCQARFDVTMEARALPQPLQVSARA